MQNTISSAMELSGYGVHSGQNCKVKFLPAPIGTNIVFLRKYHGVTYKATACYKNLYHTNLCTSIKFAGEHNLHIDMVEHCLSALIGLGIDNLFIEVDGSEMPIFDGSASFYYESLLKNGIICQNIAREYIIIDKIYEVQKGNSWAKFMPYDGSFYEVSIDFPRIAIIGKKTLSFDLDKDNYGDDISRARTFGFLPQCEELWAKGMALASSPENSLIIDQNNLVLKSQSLRYEDEFVRHKMLDSIGDLALLGKRFKGKFISHCSGHQLNLALVQKLFTC